MTCMRAEGIRFCGLGIFYFQFFWETHYNVLLVSSDIVLRAFSAVSPAVSYMS